jgi:hypothetical protein
LNAGEQNSAKLSPWSPWSYHNEAGLDGREVNYLGKKLPKEINETKKPNKTKNKKEGRHDLK